jgi:hypothetical protein
VRLKFFPVYVLRDCKSQDSVVGVATGNGLEEGGIGIRVPVGSRIFSSPYCPN